MAGPMSSPREPTPDELYGIWGSCCLCGCCLRELSGHLFLTLLVFFLYSVVSEFVVLRGFLCMTVYVLLIPFLYFILLYSLFFCLLCSVLICILFVCLCSKERKKAWH